MTFRTPSSGNGSGRRPRPAGTARSRGIRRERTAAAGVPRVRRPAPTRAVPRAPIRRPSVPLASPATRLRLGLVAVAFLLSLFAGRLLQLQGVDASAYATVADSERRTTQELSATRGPIVDRNGQVLAESVDAVNVFADQTVITNPSLTATLLAPYLDTSADELTTRLTGERKFVYVAKDLTPDQWAKIDELNLVGVYDEVVHKRVYPADSVAANVVGFVNAEGIGSAGVEQTFNAILTGSDGRVSYVTDAGGRRIPTVVGEETAPVEGQGVQLTIDRDLQYLAQQRIAEQVKIAGAKSGTVVVMDSRTQEILALATAPSYDPNAVEGTDPSRLGNRAISEVYEPGSVEKALTASALIEEGLVTPETVFTVPDRLVIDGEDYHDYDPHPTSQWTFTNVVAESSNIGTIEAADPMPAETLDSYLRAFGFGRPTGLPLPGESAGILHSPDSADYHESTRHTMAFGQGLSVTAVQMASAYATIANGGLRVEPTIVSGTTSPDGTFTPAPAAAEQRVVSADTAKQVAQILNMTVTHGTAHNGAIEGYNVAGKTGTSQKYEPTCGCYQGFTASFAGFAPSDDPRLVVYVILQNPVNGHWGSTHGGPVFHDIMTYALQKYGIPPTGAAPADLPLEGAPAE